MKNPVAPSRRQLIKAFAGAPMLPLSASLASVGLTACGGGAAMVGEDAAEAKHLLTSGAKMESVTFSSMPAPTLAEPGAMATTTVGSVMSVHFKHGKSIDFNLAYEPFFLTGDLVDNVKGGKIVAGGYFDIHGQPIVDKSVPGKERQFYSDCPDGTSLLTVKAHGTKHGKDQLVHAVVQFEYTSADQSGADMYGKLPSPIAVLTLRQDSKTGKLSLVKYHNVDTSAAKGLWITCGASLSPWGTHLSSEEYEPDAFDIASNANFKAYITNLYGDAAAANDPAKANPYHYGHMPEVVVKADGTGELIKHYCMGRISHELVQIMPDERTALMGDDTTNGGLFVFVADRKRDLSSGSLYVARVGDGLTLDTNAAGAPLTWIKLGSASSDEVKAMANSLTLADIMDVMRTDPGDASYTAIFMGGKAEWVRLKPGMEKAAAFLETHRYAALVGGSLGFTKNEGTTVNAKDKVAYIALSACRDSMVVGGKGNVPASGIALPKAVKAGAVMALKLDGNQKDHAGAAIRSVWMPIRMQALIVGEDISKDALGNTAHLDKIANPDNLKYSEAMRTLFIGEDSGMHVNNFLWAYHVDKKTLSRVMSLPAGAESTGLHAVDEINGWTYIMSNFQHAGDWSGLPADVEAAIRANYRDKSSAAVGYLTAAQRQPSLG